MVPEADEDAKAAIEDVPVAVVWRTPDGDDRLVEHELVALHGELVCARY